MGTRYKKSVIQTNGGDHPHACGDKLIDYHVDGYTVGSSPRVWGQALRPPTLSPTFRIIPTRVGTSFIGALRLTGRTDHPHACGDKLHTHALRFFFLGSSPRVWGQGKSCKNLIPAIRIIPTRVGTSLSRHSCYMIIKDHPHACGDKSEQYTLIGGAGGSSPRVWGQVSYFLGCILNVGIIPTRVGTRTLSNLSRGLF